QIEGLQNALGKQAQQTGALEKLRKDLQKAQQAAANLANQPAGGDSQARAELSKSLSALSQQAQSMGLSLPGLEEAIAALAAEQTKLMVRDLETALTDLEKLHEMAKTLEQLQQQAERLGKDLAEQLQNGQVKAAQATLEKMAEQLKSAQLSPDQLKRILDEVAKAINPAADYGKVADLLGKAAGQMQNNQRPLAAQSLADAARELEKLMEEMGDVDSLIAALKACQGAQMCLGLGEGPGCGGLGIARGGRGMTRGGRGFGTWANEEGWLTYPEMSDLWDNPPENRGIMDPRSSTDRGDGQLADNLDPTKIRGRLSPGGSMPSITLKGVSIKGMSTVSYEQAVMAAQGDAQSALSQEQIPRAYQGTVKDYFDDLKK
ncbi:MAG: hypothetical protein M1608_02700, partial [Candidatus Omnitrophica bacterium]|nr:hypothetical protein [Candidatus Omnitrophota bacterium]